MFGQFCTIAWRAASVHPFATTVNKVLQVVADVLDDRFDAIVSDLHTTIDGKIEDIVGLLVHGRLPGTCYTTRQTVR